MRLTAAQGLVYNCDLNDIFRFTFFFVCQTYSPSIASSPVCPASWSATAASPPPSPASPSTPPSCPSSLQPCNFTGSTFSYSRICQEGFTEYGHRYDRYDDIETLDTCFPITMTLPVVGQLGQQCSLSSRESCCPAYAVLGQTTGVQPAAGQNTWAHYAHTISLEFINCSPWHHRTSARQYLTWTWSPGETGARG